MLSINTCCMKNTPHFVSFEPTTYGLIWLISTSAVERHNEQLMPIHPYHTTPNFLLIYHICPQQSVFQARVS